MAGPFDGLDLGDDYTMVQSPSGPVRVPTALAKQFGPGAALPPVGPLPSTTSGAPGLLPNVSAVPGQGPQAPIDLPSVAAMAAPPIATVPLPTPVGGAPAPTPKVAKVAKPAAGPVMPTMPDPFAQAAQQRDLALASGQQGIADSAAAQGVEGDAEATALAAQNRATDQRQAEIDSWNKQQQAAQVQHVAEIDAATKAYADSKVDPSRYWHSMGTGQKILSGIAIALGALGQAFTRGQKENVGLEMIQKSIADDVALQMADRDKLKAVVGMKGQALEQLMAITKDRNATAQAAIAAGYTRVASQINQIAAASKNPIAKAQAETASSKLLSDAAALTEQAGQSSWQRKYETAQQVEQQRHNRADEGVAYANASETRRSHLVNEAREDEQWKVALGEKAREFDAKGDAKHAAAATQARDFGISDSEGQPIYQPEARPKLDRAAQLEAAAARETNPTLRQTALMQAKGLRDDALLNDTFQVPKEAATKFRDQLASAQSTSSALYDLEKMIDDGSVVDPKNNARAATLYAQIKASAGEAMHARFNEKEQATLDDIFGGDPTKIANVDDRELGRYNARFQQIRTGLAQDAQQLARRAGYRGSAAVITDPSAPDQTPEAKAEKTILGEKTAEERAQAAQPGVVANAIDHVVYPISGGKRTNPDYIREHAAPVDDTAYKLLDQHANGYANASPDQKRRTEDLLAGVLASTKPGLASVAYGVISAANPELAAKLTDKLPAEQRQALLIEDEQGQPIARPQIRAVTGITDEEFTSLSPDDLAGLASRDKRVAQYLVQRLTTSTDQAEKQKAAAAIMKLRERGAK